jgi:hypothetical protein
VIDFARPKLAWYTAVRAEKGRAWGKFMSKESAIKLVNQFKTNAALPNQWPRLSKNDFADGLIERIENPNRINQGNTPLCGPASLIRLLAQTNQDGYAQAGIDLFTKGSSRIGTLDLKPGNELKQALLPPRTESADWVMLGSLRDSDNWFFSPAGLFSGSFAGITLPYTMENWFRNAGYTQVINDTSLTGVDLTHIKSLRAKRASDYFAAGYYVALLIDQNLLHASNQNDIISMYPDHWVVLSSTIDHAGTPDQSQLCSFTVYTWGLGRRQVPQDPGKTLTYEKFLNKFYGFVAARL